MGFKTNRAICPSCGGKVHTQARGIAALGVGVSGPLVKTGTTCQWCGIALSGKVGADNKAIATDDPRILAKQAKQEAKQEAKQASQEAKQQAGDDLASRIVALLKEEHGTLTTREIASRLGVSHMNVATIGPKIPQVKASGIGNGRRLTLSS
jgi:DNA-binding NarL/FixJ family response regulator